MTPSEGWSYVLRLAEYQFKLGMLDAGRYFDGVLSLFQKAFVPQSRSGTSTSAFGLGINECMGLVAATQRLLSSLMVSSDSVVTLTKTCVCILRHLMPSGLSKEQHERVLESAIVEELATAIAHMLRDLLLNFYDVFVRCDEIGELDNFYCA